jgi:hypothetical protein
LSLITNYELRITNYELKKVPLVPLVFPHSPIPERPRDGLRQRQSPTNIDKLKETIVFNNISLINKQLYELTFYKASVLSKDKERLSIFTIDR